MSGDADDAPRPAQRAGTVGRDRPRGGSDPSCRDAADPVPHHAVVLPDGRHCAAGRLETAALEGVVEDPPGRGLAPRGRPARRWPWAVGAAMAGAATGAAAVLLARGLSGRGAAGLQDAEALLTAVDQAPRPVDDATGPPDR